MNLHTFSAISLCICLFGSTPELYGFKKALHTDEVSACIETKTQKAEFTRVISREFQTTPDGTVALYNKYGKVDVRTWSENKVKVEVTIVVVARDQAEADKTFNGINVNFMSSYGYVKAETIISFQSSGWSWANFWNSNTWSAQDYKINYLVYMPPGNNIDLKNSYGDSHLASFHGKLTADIKYGDIKSAEMSNDVDLVLAYGDGDFKTMRDLHADVSYGKLRVDYAKDVQTDTKYSEFRLQNSGDVRMVSMYDDIKIKNGKSIKVQTKYSDLELGKITSFYLTAKYTDARIEQLTESLDADLDYGGVVVSSLGDRFQSVYFSGNYADLKLAPVSTSQAYSFDLQGNYAELKYPRTSTISTENDWGSGKKVSGRVNGSSGGKIVAKVNYGTLIISN